MSTFTKEQLIAAACSRIDFAKQMLRGNPLPLAKRKWEIELSLSEIALASLEAEPVAWIIEGGKGDTPCHLSTRKEYAEAYPDRKVTPLYAAPPAPVAVPYYPETLPCPVMLDPGLRFGKGVPTKTMLGALLRRAEYHAELEAMTPEQRAEHDAGMNEFAAMLQGADGALTNEDTKRVGELVMWVKRLAHSLRKANPDSKLQSDAMDYLSRKGLIGAEDVLR